VDIALCEAGVERARLGQRLELDRVAELLELVLDEVGHAEAIGPGGDEAEGDGALVSAFAVTAAVSACGVVARRATGEREGCHGPQGHGGCDVPELLHGAFLPYVLLRFVWVRDGIMRFRRRWVRGAGMPQRARLLPQHRPCPPAAHRD